MTSNDRAVSQQLIESQGMFAAVGLSSDVGMVLQLADGTVQACNTATQSILGVTLDELQGWEEMDPPWQAIHIDGSPCSRDTYPATITLRTGQPCADVVIGVYRPAGDLVWLCLNSEPLWGRGMSPYGVVSTFTDITAQVEAQRAAMANGQVMSREAVLPEEGVFFERSPAFFAILGLDGHFKRVNAQFSETLGYRKEVLLSTPFLDFVHPDDRASTLAAMAQLETGAPTRSFESRYRTQEGTYRWLDWTASPELDQGVIYCVARDITSQKQTEAMRVERSNQELYESEQRFRIVVDHIPDAFVIYDAQRRIQFINAAGLTLTGRPVEDFLGYTDEEIYPPEVTNAYLPLLKQTVATKCFQSGECTITLPNRPPYTIGIQYVPMLDDRGEIQQILGITYDITKRIRAEESVRHNEQQIRRILDSLFSFVGVMRPDGTLIEANRTALEAAALLPEDVLGKPFEEAYWWSHSPTVQAQLRGAIAQAAQGETVRYDVEVRVKDARLITIDFTLAPLFDSAGNVEYLIPSGIDITDRKQAELALKESRAQVQRQLAEIETIYQSAPIGLNVLDRELRFVRINQRLAEMNGFSVEDHIGRTVRELLPNLADAAEQVLRPILETGEPLMNVEIVGETPAQPGIQRVWLEHFLPLKEGDRVIGINTVCEEISDRKQAEAALRASEERYRTLFESMEDGFCIVKVLVDETNTPVDYRFLELNPAFARHTGLQQAEGKTAREILPDLEDFWIETYGKVALTGEPLRFENGSDAMQRWFDVYTFRIGQPEERKVAILFRDVSDRKAIEAHREQLLLQEQAAREAAEYANRIKDEFLAVLSHELRTPLNPILGWAKLLQSPQVNPEKLERGLTTIERNARQQVQLIDDLLDVSRIIRGKLTLNFEPINLSEIITAALETVRLAIEAKHIQLGVFLASNVGQVRGDAGRLQQVVWNLLSNAIKFNTSGGQVSVHLTQSDRYAQIQVSDNGKGIEVDFLPYVFDLFRQQDSSTTRQFGGLGLGLAIVRQIVEAHGGTITVTSGGVGQGAIFTVKIPVITMLHTDSPDTTRIAALNFDQLRILAVDDEVDSLELVKVLLEEEGAIVQAVTSATEALRLLTQSQFDVLISDIGMPELDGYAFIRQVRALAPQHNRDIPAIALTAYAGDANQQQILAAGFQAHLAKPIEPQHILDAIVTLIAS